MTSSSSLRVSRHAPSPRDVLVMKVGLMGSQGRLGILKPRVKHNIAAGLEPCCPARDFERQHTRTGLRQLSGCDLTHGTSGVFQLRDEAGAITVAP
jgi:hypothetical protein